MVSWAVQLMTVPFPEGAPPATLGGMTLDPVVSNPDHYTVIFENEHVRVLEYTDRPGDRTTPHSHPNSVMYTLSHFRRRLSSGGEHRDVEIEAGVAGWLPAQEHHGENIGQTQTHVIFVELLQPAGGDPAGQSGGGELGPVTS